MRRKEFLENVAVPLLGIAVVMFIVYLFCVENGVCDYRKLWIVSGIPFGIQKMYFWMIPKGFDIGGTVGMFAFNLLIGGMIGSVVLTWRLLMVGTYLLKSIGYGGLWMTTKTGQAEWRALDENQKMRELPLAIELQDFTIDEYPPKLMLINNETGEALPSKKPENLLIEENFHTGRLLD